MWWKPRYLEVLDHLDARTPRVCQERQLEQAGDVPDRLVGVLDVEPSGLPARHPGRQISKRKANVVDARADAAGLRLTLEPVEICCADPTGAFTPEVLAPHVLDVPRGGRFRVRRGQVHVVIVGGVGCGRQTHDSDKRDSNGGGQDVSCVHDSILVVVDPQAGDESDEATWLLFLQALLASRTPASIPGDWAFASSRTRPAARTDLPRTGPRRATAG